jgi:RNA polymerase sigma-70 factor (ECF subfamily)
VTATAHRSIAGSDAELVARAGSGEEQAFRELYDRHAGAVRGYLAGRVGPDAVDDLVSETFTAAWTAADRFDPAASSARPWLYGIATNVVGRHREREARWYERISNAAARTEPREQPTAYDLDPALVRAIGTLSPVLRDVLLLSALGELALAEVAQVLRIRTTTARVRLHRARRLVRSSLEGSEHD